MMRHAIARRICFDARSGNKRAQNLVWHNPGVIDLTFFRETAVHHLSFADLLKRFRPILVITSLCGISVALLGLLAGFDGVYDGALTVATLVVILALAAQIVISLRQREFGLDTIALLSMSSALFRKDLAAAVVALMYSGGQYLESIAEVAPDVR